MFLSSRTPQCFLFPLSNHQLSRQDILFTCMRFSSFNVRFFPHYFSLLRSLVLPNFNILRYTSPLLISLILNSRLIGVARSPAHLCPQSQRHSNPSSLSKRMASPNFHHCSVGLVVLPLLPIFISTSVRRSLPSKPFFFHTTHLPYLSPAVFTHIFETVVSIVFVLMMIS